MKLDTKNLRYLTPEDWRVLTAVEMGSKNHEIVPTSLIDKIARLRGGSNGVHKSISNLAKIGLIGKIKEARYDGYRLTYGGLDYLAMHTYSQRDVVYSVGHRIGVGKESDIMMVADNKGRQRVLKIHRLGRISFRSVRSNRDYLKKRQARGSWMYLSRLSATKEYAFLQALHEEGFSVPDPLGQSRHTIVMSFVQNSLPLRQVSSVPDPAALYSELIDLILRLARHGLIHGDFNEFNILIQEQKRKPDQQVEETTSKAPYATEASETDSEIKLVPILIDFPQMVSMDHKNAEMYFDRDVACIKTFFERRFRFISTQPGPFYKDARATVGCDGAKRIDIAVEASGFTKKMSKDLEAAILEQAAASSERDSDEDYSDNEGEDSNDDGEDTSEAEEEEGSAEPGISGQGSENPGGSSKTMNSDDHNDRVEDIANRLPGLIVNTGT